MLRIPKTMHSVAGRCLLQLSNLLLCTHRHLLSAQHCLSSMVSLKYGVSQVWCLSVCQDSTKAGLRTDALCLQE
ncbi:hypothetical protein BDR22DRAFT_580025 [Usnea florida]